MKRSIRDSTFQMSLNTHQRGVSATFQHMARVPWPGTLQTAVARVTGKHTDACKETSSLLSLSPSLRLHLLAPLIWAAGAWGHVCNLLSTMRYRRYNTTATRNPKAFQENNGHKNPGLCCSSLPVQGQQYLSFFLSFFNPLSLAFFFSVFPSYSLSPFYKSRKQL